MYWQANMFCHLADIHWGRPPPIPHPQAYFWLSDCSMLLPILDIFSSYHFLSFPDAPHPNALHSDFIIDHDSTQRCLALSFLRSDASSVLPRPSTFPFSHTFTCLLYKTISTCGICVFILLWNTPLNTE